MFSGAVFGSWYNQPMSSQVDEIKSRVDVTEVISQYVKLQRSGRNYKGLCPFHSERTPSFMVSPDRGTWRCFGCGEHGDVITFLEKYENVSFIEALEQLAKRAGVVLQKHERQPGRQQAKQRLLDLLSLSAEYFHYLLTKHDMGKEAREYLAGRGVTAEQITDYKLGYAPDSWRSLQQYLIKKGFTIQEIRDSGMSNEGRSRTYDRFRDRVMFPVMDSMNRVVGFSGRSLRNDDKAPKYLNSPEGELFHKSKLLYGLSQAKEAIRKNDRLVLVEGNLDVLSSARVGIKEVVAPLGTALTSEQVSLIKRFTDNVYLAFDSDGAGMKASRRGIELLKQAELNVKVVEIIGGSDPDDCIQNNPNNWKKSLRQSVDVFDYYINWVSKEFNLSTEQGKRQASREIVPLIAATESSVAKSFLIQKAASSLAVSEEAIRQELKAVGRGERRTSHASRAVEQIVEPEVEVSRQELVAAYIVSLTLQLIAGEVPQSELAHIVKTPPMESFGRYSEMMTNVLEGLESKSSVTLNDIAAALPEAMVEEFDRLNLAPAVSGSDVSVIGLTNTGRIGHSIEDSIQDLKQAIRELQRLHIREQLNTYSQSLRQAEQLDPSRVAEIQTKIMQLSQELAELHQT